MSLSMLVLCWRWTSTYLRLEVSGSSEFVGGQGKQGRRKELIQFLVCNLGMLTMDLIWKD